MKTLENMQAWAEEMRKNYEYHMLKASEWYEEMRRYEEKLNKMKEEEDEFIN